MSILMWTCNWSTTLFPPLIAILLLACSCVSMVDLQLGHKWVGPSCVSVVDKNHGHTFVNSYNAPLPFTKKYLTNVMAPMRKENDKNDMMQALDYFRERQAVDLRFYYKIQSRSKRHKQGSIHIPV
jgi:hypothetical protein